ncbi:MAG TPA: M1 family metallopeptidase [Thermoanaerobacterales bacterium]|nr:M1 family metallopeptidase [Thermoanaerobacterales bacterium]
MIRVFNLRKVLIPLVILLIIAIGLTGYYFIYKRSEKRIYNKQYEKVVKDCTYYDIYADFNPEEKFIDAVQTVKYKNNTKTTLNELNFYLYPNAFKDENNTPFPGEEFIRAYPNGFDSGYLKINHIKVGEEKLDFRIDDIYLQVLFPDKGLKKGKELSLEISFKVIIPNCMGRFGYGDKTFNICNWYPILAVYDENGWNLDPYYPIGDPFYSESAIYNVAIEVPNNFIIASTGKVVEVLDKGDDKKIWCIETELVRDFAWTASDDYKVATTTVDDTVVSSYYFDEAGGKDALKSATEAIKFYNKYFGKYPYDTFTVAAADFYIGGMEYPNLVLIDRTLYGGSYLEYIVVHETAHQWWYGLVGNNQVKEGWLDEGLTEFSTMLFLEHKYGKEGKKAYDDLIKTKYLFFEMTNPTDYRVLKPLNEFESWHDYDALAYARGAMVFGEIRDEVCDELFRKVMNTYLRNFVFINATTDDLIKLWEKETKNLIDRSFFNKMLNIIPQEENNNTEAA